MGGTGEIFKRADGKWGWHIKARNGRIVATDGGQTYDHRNDARASLEKVMRGEYNGEIHERG